MVLALNFVEFEICTILCLFSNKKAIKSLNLQKFSVKNQWTKYANTHILCTTKVTVSLLSEHNIKITTVMRISKYAVMI